MKRALLIAGALMLMSAPLHAYVSSGMVLGGKLNRRMMPTPATTNTSDADAISDPLAFDPTVGMIEVREPRETCAEPGHPVPEPGTMAITSMGLLAAAAFRRKRDSKQK